MEGGRRPTKFGDQRPSFAPDTSHLQNQQGPPGHTPSLDQFLSGINAERNRDNTRDTMNPSQLMETPPPPAPPPHDGRPSPFHPGSQHPSSTNWNHSISSRDPSGHPSWDGPRPNATRPADAFTSHMNDMANNQRTMQKLPFSREEPRPLVPPTPNPRPMGAPPGGTNQTNPSNFQGRNFSGTHHFPSDPFTSHFQQNQELPQPRPTGPALHGFPPERQSRNFGHPPINQPFPPHEELRNQSGPRPMMPHPVEQPPPGSHHLRPQLSHRAPQFPPNAPIPHHQQRVASDNFFSEPNHQTLPSRPNQSHNMMQTRLHPPPQVTPPETSQREQDEEWLRNWTRRIKIAQPESTTRGPKVNNISVKEGRQLVVELILALRQLSQQRDMLNSHINGDESSWQNECWRANRSKEHVQHIQARLFSEEVALQLQNKLKKIRKKRTRRKRQGLEIYEKQQDVEARRKEIGLRIDAELAKRLQAEQEKKREAELQEEVDKTLFEVRKKKQEVSQALDLIKGLKKLRQLRKEAAQAKGAHFSRESDVSFEDSLKPLEELMSKQSILYREEERVMQVMLEEEHEEYKEQEKKRQRKRLEEKAMKEMRAKMELLFGKEEHARPDDPMFSFQQFYQQADNSVQGLLGIRHQWDQFLVHDEDGSSVPVSWVLPSDPSSQAWASLLDT